MNSTIRHAFVAVPLGLMLAGCSSSQRADSSAGDSGRHTEHGGDRAYVLTSDQSDEGGAMKRPSQGGGTQAPDAYHNISLDQIRKHVQDGTAVLIDARDAGEFARGHVRGARNLPAGEVEDYLPRNLKDVGSNDLIIIYCASSSCGASESVYEALLARGFTNMRVYSPGWQVLRHEKM